MKPKTIGTIAAIAIALGLISFWIGQQASSWLPPQASAESILVDRLFSVLTGIGAFIFLGVTGVLTYSALFQQVGKYDMSDGPPIEGNITLEVVWTAIPFALVLWIGLYSFQIYDQMGIQGPGHAGPGHTGLSTTHPDVAARAQLASSAASEVANTSTVETAQLDPSIISIDVFARQWAWEFRYPGGVNSTELHLPNNRRAQLLLHSEDVIHGFYVPAFRVKQDIVPNEVTPFEFTPIRPGRYRLRDSLYSGTYFAAMQADVVVESPEEYEQWLKQAAATAPTPAFNPAYAEYSRRMAQEQPPGWPTIPPAAPPVVNYSPQPGSKS